MATPVQVISSREFNQGTGEAKRAAIDGPVYITDRGQPSHVLLSFEDYERLAFGEGQTLADLLCRTPGVGDVKLELPDRTDLIRPAVFD